MHHFGEDRNIVQRIIWQAAVDGAVGHACLELFRTLEFFLKLDVQVQA